MTTSTREQIAELAKDTTLSLAEIGSRCRPPVKKQRVSVILKDLGIARAPVYKPRKANPVTVECAFDECPKPRWSKGSKFCLDHYGGKTRKQDLVEVECSLEGCKKTVRQRPIYIKRNKNHFCSREHHGRWLGRRNRKRPEAYPRNGD